MVFYVKPNGTAVVARLDDLQKFSLVYLATVYSKYHAGPVVAFEHAAALAARCLGIGIKVYSPIVHTHPIAVYGGIDPLDHKIWLAFDETMMKVSDILLVAKMVGWQESFGIAHEIEFFRERGKPVFYLDLDSLVVSDNP